MKSMFMEKNLPTNEAVTQTSIPNDIIGQVPEI